MHQNKKIYFPSKWDIRFIEMSKLIASWSHDPSTKCGAVIVRPDKTVLSVGFNGFPKNMRDDAHLYADRDTKYSRIIHWEMNALIHSPEPAKGCTLYTYPFASCDRCAVHMLQFGISRFVFPTLPEDKKERWQESLDKTLAYFKEAGVEWIEV